MALTGIGGSSALSLQAIADMRNQLDDLQRQLGTGKKSDSYAGLGLDRGLTVGLRSQLVRHLGLSGHHHPGRRAAQSDADRAVAIQQRLAADQGHDPAIAIRAGRRHSDAGSEGRQRHARFADRHAQHRGRRALPVLRPHRRSGAGRNHRSHPQRRRPQGRPQAAHRRAQAGRSRHQRPRPAGGRSADRDVGVACRGFGVAVRLQARRRHHADRRGDREPAGRRAAVDVGRSRPHQSERRRHRQIHLHPAGRHQPRPDADGDHVGDAGRRPVHHRRDVGGHRDQSAGRPHPEPRHLGQHRAGGGVRGRGRQRFLQHRCQPSAAAGRRPAVRHRDRR